MPTIKSGMTWFEVEEWIGSKVTFEQPLPSSWTLVRKLRERELYDSEDAWKMFHVPSEARGIFICEEDGKSHRQAVLKIYMQYDFLYPFPGNTPHRSKYFVRIPYYQTISKPRKIRVKQARSEMSVQANREITALQGLTKAGCSSTPSLLSWKHSTQDDERFVPGGYITYILMEKAPGISLAYFDELPREERDRIRAALKCTWK